MNPKEVKKWNSLEKKILSKCIDEGDCKIWNGRLQCGTHPYISHDGNKNINVKRFLFQLIYPDIEIKTFVLNTCKKRLCINPDHFYTISKIPGSGTKEVPIEEKFESLVIKNDLDNSCWGWSGGINEWGYGVARHQNKNILAHRVSYSINVGEIPKGKLILHSCDNPPCTNPNHLRIGTHQDNSDDKVNRNRQARNTGEKSGVNKATEIIVSEIRSSTKSQAQLARDYKLHVSTIHRIIHKQSWK